MAVDVVLGTTDLNNMGIGGIGNIDEATNPKRGRCSLSNKMGTERMRKIVCGLLSFNIKICLRNKQRLPKKHQDYLRLWFREVLFIQRLLLRHTMSFFKGASSLKDSSSLAAREEVDSRSIHVGNVDYSCTALEVERHFKSCGIVNRVTIPTNQYGHPKGFAYVEFHKIEDAQNALSLNGSELHGRKLKVTAKRTNIPGMKQYHGPRPFVSRSRGPSPFYPTPGYGRERFRPYRRYRPY